MQALLSRPFNEQQNLVLPDRDELLSIRVSSTALIDKSHVALGIVHCESALGLDLTKNLEIWSCIQWNDDCLSQEYDPDSWLKVFPGEGVGKHKTSGDLCISNYARQLLEINLRPLVPSDRSIKLEIIFPKGAELALRTSNSAFGVVDGLAVIGTQAEAQVSASPTKLKEIVDELKIKSKNFGDDYPMTFVIGENGLDLAQKLGITRHAIIKIGNWVGPLLVSAAENGVKNLLLVGYHGKLVKLAGGIFHTHNHLADGRLEILTAIAVSQGIPLEQLQLLLKAESLDSAFSYLNAEDQSLAQNLWNKLALEVELRSSTYIRRYGSWSINVGVALFNREREIKWVGPLGYQHLSDCGVTL